jgi:hypothetical protein
MAEMGQSRHFRDVRVMSGSPSISDIRLIVRYGSEWDGPATTPAILDALDNESDAGSGQSQLIEHGRQIAEELGAQAPNEIKTTLMTLLCRVEIKPDRIEIDLSRRRLRAGRAQARRMQ